MVLLKNKEGELLKAQIIENFIYIMPTMALAAPFIAINVLITFRYLKSINGSFNGKEVIFSALFPFSIFLILSLTIGQNCVLRMPYSIKRMLQGMNLKPVTGIFFDSYLAFCGSTYHIINILGNIFM